MPRAYDRDWRVEQALQEISHLVAAADEVDLTQVLRRFGESIGAERLSLFIASADAAPSALPPTDGDVVFGSASNEPEKTPDAAVPDAAAPEAVGAAQVYPTKVEIKVPTSLEEREPLLEEILARESSGFVVPIMSLPHRLHGYLDIDYPASQNGFLRSYSRPIGFFGSLLAGYFDRRRRQVAERGEVAQRAGGRAALEAPDAHPEPVLIRDRTRVLHANEAAVSLLGAGTREDVLGRAVYDFVSAQHYDQLDAHWQRLEEEQRPMGPVEQEIICLDGEERLVQAYYQPVIHAGRPAAQMLLQDITERRESEERYRRFIETATEGIWCFSVHPPLPASGKAEARARKLWERARLVECNDVTADLLGAASPDAVIDRSLKDIVELSVVKVVRAFVEANYQVRGREFTVQQKGGETRHFVLNAVGTVRHGDLTQVCGSCIEITNRVRLEQRMVEALEEQQNTIGRELHDGVGQLLTSVRMLSESFAARQGASFEEGAGDASPMERIARLAEEASRQMSSIYRGLSSKHLRDAQLPAVLRSLAADTDALPNLRCTFSKSEGLEEVGEERIKLQLYRIAQEAVSNAVKYAQSQHIEITLRREESGTVVLRVRDDGKGFDPDQSGSGESLGLYSMRYRAHAIGGSLSIESAPGKGTTVTCTVPAAG